MTSEQTNQSVPSSKPSEIAKSRTSSLRKGSASSLVAGLFLLISLLFAFMLARFSYYGLDSSQADAVNDVDVQQESSGVNHHYEVVVRKPFGTPKVDTGLTDELGNPITVACSTCHVTRKPNYDNKLVADLDEFHVSLSIAHGTISCLSCHNSEDYDALKLADGTSVEFSDVMSLCAQCHGPQARDFENGVHGGMTGFWDLSRGPQTKNNCVDCHDPHRPQFPSMIPAFKPQDRFLDKTRHDHE